MLSGFVVLGILGLLFVSALAYALRGTAGWWVPGTILVVVALLTFGMMSSGGGDVGGMGALANGVLGIGGAGLLLAGLLAFAVAGSGPAKATASATKATEPAVPLASATVVRHRRPGA